MRAPSRFCLLALLALFVLLAQGCIVLGRGTPDDDASHREYYTDDEIRLALTSALEKHDAKKAALVEVYCFNSHIFFIGEADKDFRRTAVTLADNMKGGKGVTPHWFEPGTGHKMRDASLAANIEGKLLFDKEISATRMAVSVVGGHVVLSGLVPNRKSEEAVIEIARGTRGVKSVTSYLVY